MAPSPLRRLTAFALAGAAAAALPAGAGVPLRDTAGIPMRWDLGVEQPNVKGGRIACTDGRWTTTDRNGQTALLKRSPLLKRSLRPVPMWCQTILRVTPERSSPAPVHDDCQRPRHRVRRAECGSVTTPYLRDRRVGICNERSVRRRAARQSGGGRR